MSITDQQFETIILRLESGESIRSVQTDFPHLQADIDALQDLQDFFAAQSTCVKPDPQGLKSVLRHVDLLRQASNDDERTWGSFFVSWTRFAGVAVPVLLVVAVGSYMWQPELPNTVLERSVIVTNKESMPLMARSEMAPLMVRSSTQFMSDQARASEMDMSALVESLSTEFASDMAEFESTRDSLEPLFSEQLFSYDNTTTL